MSCSKNKEITEPDITKIDIISKPIKTVKIGSEYVYNIEINVNGSVDYKLLIGPQGMTLNKNVLSWTPTDTSEFSNLIQIKVIDSHSSDMQFFNIRVSGLLIEGFQTASLDEVGLRKTVIESKVYQRMISTTSKIHSTIILKNESLVLEEYYWGITNSWPIAERKNIDFSRDISHFQASTTKSLISILVGIALDKGFIDDLDDPIVDYFPEYISYENYSSIKSTITVRHLLTMTSGLYYGSPDWQSFESNITNSNDWVKAILDSNMHSDPGETWDYFSGGPHILGAIVANASGISLQNFANQYLFEPLKIKGVEWALSPKGRPFGGGCHKMRPIDMAKLGQLYSNNGIWKGERIISEEYIKASTMVYNSPSDGYGFLWWRPTCDADIQPYLAAGGGGQEIYVFPEQDIVVVFTAGYYESGEGHDYALSFINEAIL